MVTKEAKKELNKIINENQEEDDETEYIEPEMYSQRTFLNQSELNGKKETDPKDADQVEIHKIGTQ